MVEVKAGHNEQRGLVQLRNQLVAYLAQRVSLLKGEEGEGVTEFLLPEPINFESACSKCDYLGKNVALETDQRRGCKSQVLQFL